VLPAFEQSKPLTRGDGGVFEVCLVVLEGQEAESDEACFADASDHWNSPDNYNMDQPLVPWAGGGGGRPAPASSSFDEGGGCGDNIRY